MNANERYEQATKNVVDAFKEKLAEDYAKAQEALKVQRSQEELNRYINDRIDYALQFGEVDPTAMVEYYGEDPTKHYERFSTLLEKVFKDPVYRVSISKEGFWFNGDVYKTPKAFAQAVQSHLGVGIGNDYSREIVREFKAYLNDKNNYRANPFRDPGVREPENLYTDKDRMRYTRLHGGL